MEDASGSLHAVGDFEEEEGRDDRYRPVCCSDRGIRGLGSEGFQPVADAARSRGKSPGNVNVPWEKKSGTDRLGLGWRLVLSVKTVSDVAVVGGGPAGSFATLNLVRHGASVTVFEEHGEIGVPCHCAGHLSIKGLKTLGLWPLPKGIVENTFRAASFFSPNGRQFTVRFPSPVTCVVNRSLFDKHIAEMAEAAGAEYRLDARVESLIMENDLVKGVVVNQDGKVETERAKIVVDAEGISPRLLKQTVLASMNRRMVANGVEAEVENVRDVELDAVEVFLGTDYAPGLYAWLIPKRDGTAKVGLGASRGNPIELLQRFMHKHPVASRQLAKVLVLRKSFHPVTLGGSIAQAYCGGFLAVGDVASQVKPTTGGGVVLGLTCARIAADVVGEALATNDFSSRSLSMYQKRCAGFLGFDMRVMLRIRRMFNSLSDSQLDDLIAFGARFGVDKVLSRVGDIDLQGRALLRVLPSVRTMAALSYFLWLCACANP